MPPQEGASRTTDSTLFSGDGWGAIVDRGERAYMEDRFVAKTFAWDDGTRRATVYGVFDGHNGASVAEHCQRYMADQVVGDMRTSVTTLSSVAPCLRKSFHNVDDSAAAAQGVRSHEVGSTACVAVVTQRHVWVANAGDSRAVLRIASNQIPYPLSEDHKPSGAAEMERIRLSGGTVSHADGIARISGLSLSRSIGDRARRPHVICTPDVRQWRRDEKAYMLMASDGVWDVMSNQEVVDIVDNETSVADGLRQVLAEARRRRSRDNITILFVQL